MADAAGDSDIDPALFARLAADPLADRLGITLEQVRPGYARAVMPVGPDLLNAVGTEVHRSNRSAVYRIEARADDGRLVATALARVFRTDRPWVPA